jgi:hypothetical protein
MAIVTITIADDGQGGVILNSDPPMLDLYGRAMSGSKDEFCGAYAYGAAALAAALDVGRMEAEHRALQEYNESTRQEAGH